MTSRSNSPACRWHHRRGSEVAATVELMVAYHCLVHRIVLSGDDDDHDHDHDAADDDDDADVDGDEDDDDEDDEV